MLFRLEKPVGNLLLLLQIQLCDPLLEVSRGVAHDDHRCLGESLRVEFRKQLFPIFLDQVALELHHDVVAGLVGGDGVHRSSNGTVIQADERPVQASRSLGAEPACLCPLQHHAVAELGVLGVLLLPHVQPIEGALIGKSDNVRNIELAILRLFLRGDFAMGLAGLLHHVALEGKRTERGGSEICVDGGPSIGHVGVQGLALQVLRQRLGLTRSHAILEEADGVEVRATLLQVQEDAEDGLDAEPCSRKTALAVRPETGLGVEAD
mmetsp:Transcript_22045/g.48167  ORF Transcript_22045/g.48167 Transcript_22045/m.48167 type:complete len:265 (+) Transcript_22045:1417-2211(+)